MRNNTKSQKQKIVNPYVNNQYKFKSKHISQTTVNQEINTFLNNSSNLSNHNVIPKNRQIRNHAHSINNVPPEFQRGNFHNQQNINNEIYYNNTQSYNSYPRDQNFYNNNLNTNNYINNQQNRNIEIECRNISKTIKTSSFKAEILQNINLKIYQGEIVIILGPSGSGKTTLLNVIAGIEHPTGGDVYIKGKIVNKLNDKELTEFRRNHIAYIYQRYGLVPISTVWDNIKLGQNLVPKNKRTVNIDEVINIVGIEKIKNKFPHELSGGQKQRVAIARAILKQPEIMLCDEPTGALDDETSKNIIDLFLKVNKEFNTTIVMVTHNNSLVSIATKIIRIQDGKIVGIEERNKNSNFLNPFNK